MDQREIQRIVEQVREALGSRSSAADDVASASELRPLQELPRLVTEALVSDAAARGDSTILLAPGAIITPLGRDALNRHGIAVASGLGIDAVASPANETGSTSGTLRVAIGAFSPARELESAATVVLRDRSLTPIRASSVSRDAAHVAKAVAGAVASGTASWGVAIEPIGMMAAAVANRVPGVIAAVCTDPLTARWARARLGANMLCISSEMTTPALLREILDAWIDTAAHVPPDSRAVFRDLDGRREP